MYGGIHYLLVDELTSGLPPVSVPVIIYDSTIVLMKTLLSNCNDQVTLFTVYVTNINISFNDVSKRPFLHLKRRNQTISSKTNLSP